VGVGALVFASFARARFDLLMLMLMLVISSV
jgi:hypothetical protein